jgi:hypothetical protein
MEAVGNKLILKNQAANKKKTINKIQIPPQKTQTLCPHRKLMPWELGCVRLSLYAQYLF